MTSLSPQDLELAKKHGEIVEGSVWNVEYQLCEGHVIFTQDELSAFLAERDTQHEKELADLKSDIESYIAENARLVNRDNEPSNERGQPMKSYHLTQKEADALALKVKPECKYVNGYELYLESLTAIINAALDQVLGEPVAEAFIDSFGDLKIYPTGIASKALIVTRGDSKLYAPKEQS